MTAPDAPFRRAPAGDVPATLAMMRQLYDEDHGGFDLRGRQLMTKAIR